MIKTLIVDDENLVRKWLIFSLADSRLGLQVVGDAPSGERALELIGQRDVELLITDLTMPGMSGIELMKEAQARYPNIWMVVLTCHQDFNYIQEALRIGAIDYIVKTQLEQEKLEDTLQRIINRINRGKMLGEASANAAIQSPPGNGLLFIHKNRHKDQTIERLPEQLLERLGALVPIGDCDGWIPRLRPDNESALREHLPDLGGRWIVVRIEQLNMELETSHAWLESWIPELLFYRSGDGDYIQASARHYARNIREGTENSYKAAIEKAWNDFDWMLKDDAFDQWRGWIEESKPASEWLTRMMLGTVLDWSHIPRFSNAGVLSQLAGSSANWNQWLTWLGTLRRQAGELARQQSFSTEVLISLFRAIFWMKKELEAGINQNEIAHRVQLSRGYFSDCFKEAFGKSFSEFMKELRIDRASELLMASNDPIYSVAQQAGFQDEKYFSRVFRERMGMLPSEYRAASGKKQ